MNMQRTLLAISSLVTFLGVPLAHAIPDEEIQSLASIQKTAETFVIQRYAPTEGRITAETAPLDPRLRLAACAEPLQASLPSDRTIGSRISVAVRCLTPVNWAVYVPVNVHIYQPVLIAAQSFARGDAISADKTRSEERDTALLNEGYLTKSALSEPALTNRLVQAGSVLTPSMLAPQKLVRRNEQVSLSIAAGSVQVRTTGIALDDGGAGARVRVRNISSGRTVEAIVQAMGLVTVLP